MPPADFTASSKSAGNGTIEDLVARAEGGGLLGVALGVLGNRHDAEDACQEAWLAVLAGLDGFRGVARLSTWVHRILLNVCRTELRRRGTDARALQRLATRAHPPPDLVRRTVESRLLGDERRDRIARRLRALPKTQQSVVMLRHIRGVGTHQTAAALATTPGAVRQHMCRARRVLRTRLRAELDTERIDGAKP